MSLLSRDLLLGQLLTDSLLKELGAVRDIVPVYLEFSNFGLTLLLNLEVSDAPKTDVLQLVLRRPKLSTLSG